MKYRCIVCQLQWTTSSCWQISSLLTVTRSESLNCITWRQLISAYTGLRRSRVPFSPRFFSVAFFSNRQSHRRDSCDSCHLDHSHSCLLVVDSDDQCNFKPQIIEDQSSIFLCACPSPLSGSLKRGSWVSFWEFFFILHLPCMGEFRRILQYIKLDFVVCRHWKLTIFYSILLSG